MNIGNVIIISDDKSVSIIEKFTNVKKLFCAMYKY